MKTFQDYKKELSELLNNTDKYKTKKEKRAWKIQVDALRSHLRLIS